MDEFQDFNAVIIPNENLDGTHWIENRGAGRGLKALICVSLFSVILIVSVVCCVAALLRAFAS